MPLFNNFVGTSTLTDEISIQNGQDHLTNPAMRRPFFDKKGFPRVIANTGQWTVERGQRVPIKRAVKCIDLIHQGNFDPVLMTANTSALRKEQWQEMDQVVLKAYRQRLSAWMDLANANRFGGFDAMARMTLEYEAMSDPGEAVVDMDALTEGNTDHPLFVLRSIPLPITHADFWFSQRRLKISANGGTPFDSVMAETNARRIGETVERSVLGTTTGITYGTQTAGAGTHDGTSTVYGYLTHPDRIQKNNMTDPTTEGWVPDVLYREILTCIKLLKDDLIFGDYQVYYSPDWFEYMQRAYSVSGGNHQGKKLQQMIEEIPRIKGVKELDFLNDQTFTIVIVQMTSDVARAIDGQGITTVQWPSQGGMRLNFKTLCIQVPQIRSDYEGRCGILVATTE